MIDPARHLGRDCSPDCAEFGCARWTAADRRVRAERRERTRRLTDHIGRGTYTGDREAHSHAESAGTRRDGAAGADRSGGRP